jgi:hypothetical protein
LNCVVGCPYFAPGDTNVFAGPVGSKINGLRKNALTHPAVNREAADTKYSNKCANAIDEGGVQIRLAMRLLFHKFSLRIKE